MIYLGSVIEEAHNLLYENKLSFTSWELLDHLVDRVIPHGKTIIFHTEVPIVAPTLPTL